MTDTLTKAAEAIINSYEYARTNEERQTMLETEQPFWNDVTKAAANEILNGVEVMGLVESGIALHDHSRSDVDVTFLEAKAMFVQALTAINKLKESCR